MKSPQTTTILDSVVYGIIMMIANAAGTVAFVFFNMIVNATIGQEAANRHYIVFAVLYALLAVSVTWFGIRLYFKYKIPDICKGAGNQSVLRGSFLFVVLPAEILRFLLCCLPTMPGPVFGCRFCDGIFAIAPNFLYSRLYLLPTYNYNLEDIRDFGYLPADNIVFILFYLVYFVIHIAVLYLLFSRAWEAYERERDSEVKIRMDPEQMK